MLFYFKDGAPRKCGEMFDMFFQLKNQKQTIGRGGTFRTILTIFIYEYIYIYLRIAKTNQPLNGFMDIYPQNGSFHRMAGNHGPSFVGCLRSWGGKLTGKKKHDVLFKMDEWRNLLNFFIQVRIQISCAALPIYITNYGDNN